MLSRKVADELTKGYNYANPRTMRMLSLYGIGRNEFDLLKTISDLSVVDDHKYLTPDDAFKIDDGAAESLLWARNKIDDNTKPEIKAKLVQKLKQDIGERLSAYFGDAARHGVITSGVRERVTLLGEMRPGDIRTELWKSMLQFKMWPVAAMYQAMGREFYTALDNRNGKIWNIGLLIGMSAMAGYMRMCINDAATGKPLRQVDPKTLLAALAQGGGLGIFGDYMFGEVNRMGGGFMSTVAGPLASDADVIWKMFTRSRAAAEEGDIPKSRDIWPDLAHFAVRNIPGENLIYLKGALDYLLWYHLYEAASPGWWERTNRRLEKEQGRTLGGYVPGAGVPYTPWG